LTSDNLYENQISKLKKALNGHIDSHGASLCQDVDMASRQLLKWLYFLRESESTGTADILLDGTQSVIIEAAACLSMGLVRPALLSFRAQADMLLAWLYFRTHPIEWNLVETTGEGYKLKAELIRYLEDFVPDFKKRFGLLRQSKSRREDDPYRFISGYIHSQSSNCVPTIEDLKAVVGTKKICIECLQFQLEVTKYLSDILFSVFADKWASLPDCVVEDAKHRLTSTQIQDFFP